METVQHFGKYKFSENELFELGSEIAEAVDQKNEAERQMKAVQADFKSRIAKAEETIQEASKKRRDGYEYRNLECVAEMDEDRKTVVYRRADTMEVIDRRPMNDGDMQRNLFEG